MNRIFNESLAVIFLAVTVCFSSGCGNKVYVTGRISFGEDWGCFSLLQEVQDVDWARCHGFKHHFNETTGLPVLENRGVERTLRPISASIRLQHWKIETPPGSNVGVRIPCGAPMTVQTDREGVYLALIDRCGDNTQTYLTGEVFLQYQFRSYNFSRQGNVRAMWRHSLADSVFSFGTPGDIGATPGFTSSDGIVYSIPKIVFRSRLAAEPTMEPHGPSPTLNFGTTVFLREDSSDHFNYMRQVLSAYQTIVELHFKMREIYSNRTSATATNAEHLYYDNLFADTGMAGWNDNYMVAFDIDRNAASSYNGINLSRPDRELFSMDANSDGEPDGSLPYSYFISDTGTLSHEFGHTIHLGFAPEIPDLDYSFATPGRRPIGSPFSPQEYNVGHDFGQYQELGVALAEGAASAIGQYLMNQCLGWTRTRPESPLVASRPFGGPNPFNDNIWNGDESCHNEEFCNSHRVLYSLYHRYPESSRVTSDGDPRISSTNFNLRRLTAMGVLADHRFVTSNNEAKVAVFLCDLLDDLSAAGTDVSHVTGENGNRNARYIKDFTYEAGRVLSGQIPVDGPDLYGRYSADDPTPEQISLSLSDLLFALKRHCLQMQPDGTSRNVCVDGRDVASPGTFGTSRYNETRLSVFRSPLSAQNLGLSLINLGFIRGSRGTTPRQELNNLLRSNHMETVPE